MSKAPTGLMMSDVEQMLNDTPGHIYWKDREGRYLGCNLRQAQSCGFDSIEAFVGKNDFELIAHEEAEIIRANDLEVMASNSPWTKEETVQLQGKILTFLSHKMPLRNEAGDVVGIIGMSFDITDKKQLIDSLSGGAQELPKKYKAILQNIPKEDKDYLKSKNCILLISIDNPYQQGEKFRATLQTINASLRSCTIIVGDVLNRRYLQSSYPDKNSAELYNIAEKLGDNWLLKHQSMIEQELKIPYEIFRWREFLNHPQFPQKLSEVKNLFASNYEYKTAVHNTISDFLTRKTNNLELKISYEEALEYLLEECAIMLIWFDEQYHYSIYPSEQSEAVDATARLLEPEKYKKWQLSTTVQMKSITLSKNETINNGVDLKQIIKDLPGHIYWKNKHGMFLGCNLRQAQICDFNTVDELVGKSDFDLISEKEAKIIRKNDIEVMKSKTTWAQEESVELKGKIHTFLSYKKALKNSFGDSIGILGISLDITRQKELEEELVEKNHLLEEALDAKAAFVNNMSHEIRTPVHGFTALAEGLALNWDQFDDKKRQEVASQISSNAKRLSNLLGHLLDLAKFNEGKMKLTLEEFNLVESINSIIEEAKALYMAEKNITINFAQTGRVLMNADRERISQVLRNIVVNAIKFSPKNGQINIALNDTEIADHKAIEIVVTDQGIGIPEQELETIFEPFVQSSRVATKAGGTGLGLSIVKEIVELHHGKVWAKNNEDRGANFHVILPVIDMSVERNIPKKQDRDYKILMIDDEEICLTGTELFLTLAPEYSLIKCRNGQEALDYLKIHSDVDLILLDMMMPDMGGIEVLEALSKDEHLRKIAVLLQSGISDEKEMNKAHELNATNFIAKPYNSTQLINKLNKILAEGA